LAARLGWWRRRRCAAQHRYPPAPGVALFGAIFSNRLAAHLADELPPGSPLPAPLTPRS